MPKLKTKKKAAKRFRITKTGKVMAKATGRRHLLCDKSSKKLRQMRRSLEIKGSMGSNVKSVLPYS
ncbi:50S ribosomal protein L35 [candidate division FCPU426 bacterium]|nr:50S ribosomal protein L35 [candidate division FCPU426 bacterium]